MWAQAPRIIGGTGAAQMGDAEVVVGGTPVPPHTLAVLPAGSQPLLRSLGQAQPVLSEPL
jgi:hypothetical protein